MARSPGDETQQDRGPAELPIEDALDLHAFHPRDIPVVVSEYLWEAARRSLTEVRIIHGKGIGVQRRIVAGVLKDHPAVESYRPASADRGHWGATIVKLRPEARRQAASKSPRARRNTRRKAD